MSKEVEVEVQVGDVVHDGKGGFVAKGAKLSVGAETAKSLKERGYAK